MALVLALLASTLAFAAVAQTAPGPAGGDGDPLTAARRALAAGDRAAAVAVLAAAVEEAGSGAVAPPVLSLLAGLHVEAGRAGEALDLLAPRLGDDASGDGPATAELLFVAARAARALDRTGEAEAYLARSAAAAPRSRAAVLLATLRSQQGRHGEAAALLAPIVEPGSFEIAVQQDPGFAAEIALHYGRTRIALGEPGEAIPYLRRAAELLPDDRDAWHLLGETLVEAGRVDEAREVLERVRLLEEEARRETLAQAARRDEARTKVEEAMALRQGGDTVAALERIREARELAPEEPVPALLEARFLTALERREEALTAARELGLRFPGSADALHQAALSLLAFGEVAAAEAELRRALALAPEHGGALLGLAQVLLRMGRLPEAEEVVDRLLTLRPGDPGALAIREQLELLRPEAGGAGPG